jgi:hypothetical protein
MDITAADHSEAKATPEVHAASEKLYFSSFR